MDANLTLNALTLVVALLGIINAWVLVIIRANSEAMKKLRETDDALTQQISAIRELVAGQYLTRSEFQTAMNAQTLTFSRGLERIESKIESKADRRSSGDHNR